MYQRIIGGKTDALRRAGFSIVGERGDAALDRKELRRLTFHGDNLGVTPALRGMNGEPHECKGRGKGERDAAKLYRTVVLEKRSEQVTLPSINQLQQFFCRKK
jgi:hypothetical protein